MKIHLKSPISDSWRQDALKKIKDIQEKNPGISITKELLGGATNTLKYLATFDGAKLFIKIGEKVEREKEVYKQIEDNDIFLKNVNLQNESSDLLVLPYYEGVSLEEKTLQNPSEIAKHTKLIIEVLQRTFSKYWVRNIKKNGGSDFGVSLLKKRYLELNNHINAISFESGDEYSFDGFATRPVVIQKNNKEIKLPSIKQMTEKILKLLDKLKPYDGYGILGDFQPPNILISKEGIKIVDISNVVDAGDIAFDIGKFFNYYNRFFSIAVVRDGHKNNNSHKITIKNGIIYVHQEKDHYSYADKKIIETVEEDFCVHVAKELNDYTISDRVKLYKFVVSLLTIKRHLQFDGLDEMLIGNLVDAYYEIHRKVLHI